jgi:transcriptional regulator with XRE-family HTH domain
MTQETVGGRVRRLREAREMTRDDLAAVLGLSAQWVKKFENGDRQADPRISVLQAIAKTLGVPLSSLLEDEGDAPPQAHAEDADTAMLRAVLLAPSTAATRRGDLGQIWQQCEYGFASFQAGRYGALLGLLPNLVTTCRALPDDPASARCAYRAHHLAAITLMKFEGGTAAWYAGERALALATVSQDPVAIALAAQAMTYTMTTIGAAEIGMDTAVNYARQLEDALSDGSVPGASALGMLWLKGAVAAAEHRDSAAAHDMLEQARRCAEHVPIGANFMSTGFDALNVQLYQVSIDAAFSRYAPAASGADLIGQDALRTLPRERRTHHLIEAATTYTKLGRDQDALTAMLRAEADNPQELRNRPAARDAIKQMLAAPGPVSQRLRLLAQRSGIEP